jgi:hypothetical protein
MRLACHNLMIRRRNGSAAFSNDSPAVVHPEKLWFTSQNPLRFFSFDLNHFAKNPVNSRCSRKTFVMKLSGLVAVAGLAPRILARAVARAPARPPSPLVPRPEPRSVPRTTEAF